MAAVRLRGYKWRWLQQRCGCDRGMRGQWSAQLLQRRAATVYSERSLLVLFNLLLVAIKEVGSKRSLLVAFVLQEIVASCDQGGW
ncbi:hypothetical protein BHM03_00052098 [Ensete ventricosum]|nr:hypothetical protein BHM03_00052098 [Ensete ventricosum]